ncbi:lipase/acyltransferase domain-containing protein [Amycolatopsis sp. lyj-346]|uniref:lipase/acyltransferase domain-containing protein n=1 Tax=Amycolatopsis sp. lyj-346 TaxID=2789289 RepID=UPI00397BCFB4
MVVSIEVKGGALCNKRRDRVDLLSMPSTSPNVPSGPSQIRLLHDAVIVVPGIMGSTLKDLATGKTLWGVGELFKYSVGMHSDRLRALAVTDRERSGQCVRIEATGVLNVADWLPGLGGAQPYSEIIRRLRKNAVHKNAVMAFPYDWRLSVTHNGALLRTAAQRHLRTWRDHAAHRRYLQSHPEAGPARLLFIAHSMGGLLVRELMRYGDIAREIRAVLTAGTPFQGSVKAAIMLNSGEGAPVPIKPPLLREVAATMPGLYDLLPSYRALDDGRDMRRPGVQDFVALGGREDLARTSFEWRQGISGSPLPKHSMVVGFGHRTLQSYRMTAAGAVGQEFMYTRDSGDRVLVGSDGVPRREDRQGDGTVYRFAAHLRDSEAALISVRQEHSALIRSSTVGDLAIGMLSGLSHPDELGVMLGDGQLGLDVPEWAEPGKPFPIGVTQWDGKSAPTCIIREVTGSGAVHHLELRPAEGRLTTNYTLHQTGLYEIEVTGGREPVFRLILVVAPEQ